MVLRAIATRDERSFFALTLKSLTRIEPPFSGEPFVCLIWDHVGGRTSEARIEFARRLIDGGCRYAVCGGSEADRWHDALDLASIGLSDQGRREGWKETFVMTAGQSHEKTEDVAFFFSVAATEADAITVTKFLLLHIGTGPSAEPLEAAVKRYVESPAA